MAKLLYVTCNVQAPEKSRTLTLGNLFLEQYLRWHPNDEVWELDLYRDNIPHFDQDLIRARALVERGEESLLSDEEQRKMARVRRLADQFACCDKYVFVTHSFNLWFPAEFKTYVDAICFPYRTYLLTRFGAQGMLPELGRKSLHLHATPSFPYGQEQDLSVSYLRSLLHFLNVPLQETVLLEGDDPERASVKEQEAARHRLLDLAAGF